MWNEKCKLVGVRERIITRTYGRELADKTTRVRVSDELFYCNEEDACRDQDKPNATKVNEIDAWVNTNVILPFEPRGTRAVGVKRLTPEKVMQLPAIKDCLCMSTSTYS